MIQSKKVLACLIRGTDYTKLRPKGHPIQPSIDELISKAKEIMQKENLSHVYLATEEKYFSNEFQKAFGGSLIENKRQYFDSVYHENNLSHISQANFEREDDDFLKILEYMSSINILSNCESLVTGLCGGSEAAIYFNGKKYNSCFIFDKGIY